MRDDLLFPATSAEVSRKTMMGAAAPGKILSLLWWFAGAALCLIIGVKLLGTLQPLSQILAAPFRVFFYPLELEWREGSFWLDALALHEKAPIYDHSVFAYVSMAHGPMDSLLKSWIAGLFPFLAPWQVTRAFVVLLPVTLVTCSAMILRRHMRFPWMWGTLVGLTFYVAFLAANGGHFYLYGRTDDTAIVLSLVAFTLLHFAAQSPNPLPRNGCSFAAGLLLGASYLTIWRNFPVMGAMVLVAIVAISLQTGRWQSALMAMLFCIAGTLSVFLVILFGVMGGSISLFYEHFYKLFLVSYDTSASNRGLLGIPKDVWDDLQPAWESVVHDRDNFLRRFGIIVMCPVFLVSAAWFPIRERFSHLRSVTYLAVFIGLYVLALSSLIVGYLVHWRAGSLAYLAPIYLMSWYMVCLSLIARPFAAEALRGGMSAFLTCGIILLTALNQVRGTSAGNEGARAMELTNSARAFDFQLSQLKAKYTVISDAFHFFKRHIDSNDVVDQGDFSWRFAKEGYFGEAFTQTVNRYTAAIQSKPPDIVIVGQISAPPIRALVEHGYSCILCGVRFHADSPYGFSLYARDDLPIDELRAQFSVFKTPSAPGK
jgi:hypothetical protein